MSEFKNSDVLRGILHALYNVAGRRTSQNFAVTVMGAIAKTLEQKYDFLKYIRIQEGSSGDSVIDISSDIDSIHPAILGKAIEAIIRVVYMDLKKKAGFFFITELKKHAGERVISELRNYGVDLDLLQLEQHYLYRRRERKKSSTGDKEKKQHDDVGVLGYSWNNVSSWKYDPNSKVCVIYGNDGKELDKLNLDVIIRNYIGSLTEDGVVESPGDYGEEEIEINEKEFELLKMLYLRDMDAETAIALLHISQKELDSMIRRLLKIEMLHYVSYDEVELTEMGISHLSTKEKK
jgi:hypothetical protein